VAVLAVFVAAGAVVAKSADRSRRAERLLNVSYDATRELYIDLNRMFAGEYGRVKGRQIGIAQSHGGSSHQARAVIEGLEADVVTFALYSDVDLLRKHGLIAQDWSSRLPNHSQPYTSTIVFVVRKGNPSHLADWPDLVRPGVAVVMPSPRTSGNGKLAFLAAWGSVLRRGGDEAAARAFVSDLYMHVVALEAGARASTMEFADDKVGDVHLTWENEAQREVSESGGDLQIVYPPTSIRAEPYVAWVDANVARRGTEGEARAYLEYLFTPAAQEAIARHGYRPYREDILKEHADRFPAVDLFPVTIVAKDWDDAVQRFFSEGGVFDGLRVARAR
jgi:sulfate transport system substrate-binding protein